MMDREALGARLAAATRTVDRLQAQPYYADDAELVSRYADQRAHPPGVESVRRWHDYLAADRARGVTWRQLLIVRTPLSLYWRAVMEWAFAYHTEHEEIRVLEAVASRRWPDFYVIDGRDVLRMDYTDDGEFEGAVELRHTGSDLLMEWNITWPLGTPFTDWYDRHPQYKRGIQAA